MHVWNVKPPTRPLAGDTAPGAPHPSAPIDRKDLPRLDLLRSFEAAARHLSFTLAAQELFLTQSAVSRQIQQMEGELGLELFERQHRALALTPAGTALYRVVLDCLERLRDTTVALRAQADRASAQRQVSITTTPGFASLWLIPRLARFTLAHPQVDVRLATSLDLEVLERKGFDLAVRLVANERAQADARASGATVTPVFDEMLMPVCAPALLKRSDAPLRSPQDLARHTLLGLQFDMAPGVPTDNPLEDWEPWLQLMGLHEVRGLNMLRFTQFTEVVSAAVAGQGVMMGRFPLLAPHLKSRQLVAPFKGRAASQRGYYLLQAPRAQANPDAQDFAAWLLAEARAPEGQTGLATIK